MLTNKQVKVMLEDVADLFIEKEAVLSQLDSVIGDGDHGLSMARGAVAAKKKLSEAPDDETISTYFKMYGRALIATIGGAMGPLFGSVFIELAKSSEEQETFNATDLLIGLTHGCHKVMALGQAEVGDKTMVDAMVATCEYGQKACDDALDEVGLLDAMELGAQEGLKSTIPLRAKRGRAQYLEDKSIGHQDAGATSFTLLVMTLCKHMRRSL